MSTLASIHAKLEQVLPLPEDCPKIYVLGDTGAGKSSVLQHVLGTKGDSFPSTLKRRTTVAITEYIVDKNLPFKLCLLFKKADEVLASIEETVEACQARVLASLNDKKPIDISGVIEDLSESPDQRFRLKYLVSNESLAIYAQQVVSFCMLHKGQKSESTPICPVVQNLFDEINECFETEIGTPLGSQSIVVVRDFDEKAQTVECAKRFLKSSKDSWSPLVAYARVQGDLRANWLDDDHRFVIIDGEGIGHDLKDSAVLSMRHRDYFDFADAIVLAEGAGKPFAAGGKSVVEGVIKNGFVEKFSLLMTKLDELYDEEDEELQTFDGRKLDTQRSFKNLDQALAEKSLNDTRWQNCVFYTEGLNHKDTPNDSKSQLALLFKHIEESYKAQAAQAKKPEYDFEMLSAFIDNANKKFHQRWSSHYSGKPWQTIKAFNKRMCWVQGEYRDLKPVSVFQDALIEELRKFVSEPIQWPNSMAVSERQEIVDKMTQLVSRVTAGVSQDRIQTLILGHWQEGENYSGGGSTTKRDRKIKEALKIAVPNHTDSGAVTLKETIKSKLIEALDNTI